MLERNPMKIRKTKLGSFYTPTKSVGVNSTQNNDSCSSRNTRDVFHPASKMDLWRRAPVAVDAPIPQVPPHLLPR